MELGKAWKRRGSGGCGENWDGRKGNVPSLTAHVTDRNRNRERENAIPLGVEEQPYMTSAQQKMVPHALPRICNTWEKNVSNLSYHMRDKQ